MAQRPPFLTAAFLSPPLPFFFFYQSSLLRVLPNPVLLLVFSISWSFPPPPSPSLPRHPDISAFSFLTRFPLRLAVLSWASVTFLVSSVHHFLSPLFFWILTRNFCLTFSPISLISKNSHRHFLDTSHTQRHHYQIRTSPLCPPTPPVFGHAPLKQLSG